MVEFESNLQIHSRSEFESDLSDISIHSPAFRSTTANKRLDKADYGFIPNRRRAITQVYVPTILFTMQHYRKTADGVLYTDDDDNDITSRIATSSSPTINTFNNVVGVAARRGILNCNKKVNATSAQM